PWTSMFHAAWLPRAGVHAQLAVLPDHPHLVLLGALGAVGEERDLDGDGHRAVGVLLADRVVGPHLVVLGPVLAELVLAAVLLLGLLAEHLPRRGHALREGVEVDYQVACVPELDRPTGLVVPALLRLARRRRLLRCLAARRRARGLRILAVVVQQQHEAHRDHRDEGQQAGDQLGIAGLAALRVLRLVVPRRRGLV